MTGRFVERFILPKGVVNANGWDLKSYEVTVDGRAVDAAITEAAVGVAETQLAPVQDDSVGFVILHQGTDSIWLLIGTWHEEIVHHSTHFASLDRPTAFAKVEAGGPTVCVWELPVHAHEYVSYISEVLNPQDGPNYASYLADQLTIEPVG